MDLQGRLMSMQTAHRSYMVTGAICTAAAAWIEGTVVHRVTRPEPDREQRDVIRIANPYGILDATVSASSSSGSPLSVDGVTVGRTARHILDGVVHVPGSLFPS
jgi:2-methylaconitate cis-trans-isomerase PrpF